MRKDFFFFFRETHREWDRQRDKGRKKTGSKSCREIGKHREREKVGSGRQREIERGRQRVGERDGERGVFDPTTL